MSSRLTRFVQKYVTYSFCALGTWQSYQYWPTRQDSSDKKGLHHIPLSEQLQNTQNSIIEKEKLFNILKYKPLCDVISVRHSGNPYVQYNIFLLGNIQF